MRNSILTVPGMTQKKCLHCSSGIKGRADKKFCNDFCRNSYNNQLKGENNNHIRNVNNSLRMNRKILTTCLASDEVTVKVTREKLLQRGFQFKYFTHHSTRYGKTYFFCYEYGYLPLKNDLVLIIKHDED